MSIITAELSGDAIDDWFRIGQDAGAGNKPVAVASSALQGHLFDSKTGCSHMPDMTQKADSRLPTYRRSNYQASRLQYIDKYRKEEEDDLLSQAAGLSGRLSPSSTCGQLENLDLDTTVAGGSVAMPDDLIPEGALAVYKHYDFNHRTNSLPVMAAREKIISTIESNQVTIIKGPTGSGKTTQVPQFILDQYAEESRYCNIIVTQPRKIAATSIANRVCDERGWSPGSVCGYQIGLDKQASEDTRLLYCTTGVLKEKFIGKKNMHEYTHVILDEVHERDIETDFLLLIVKKLLRTNSRHVKIILMSATIDTSVFANYFALPVMNRLEPAPVVSVGSTNYPVPEFFADDLTSRLGEVPPIDECSPRIDEGMYEMAAGLVQEFDLLEIKEQGKDEKTAFAPIRGTVLVFLPGLAEITRMQENLSRIDGSFLTLIPLHSSVTLSEQQKVFRKPAKGYRKVILSTNIAESSITVPDIKYVIDFCLTKNLFCDPETNWTHLQTEWASKANTKQRKGRAGRVSNGRVYYMVPRWFYETHLPEYGTPEMQRSPLESLVLKTKIFDMGEPKALLALALSPPKLEDIERTILSLKEVGALSSSVGQHANPYDGDLTFLGRVLAGLPVSIFVGKLLVLGHVFGMLEECLIIGAALSVKSIFATPFDKKLNAYRQKFQWSANSLSDCISVLYGFTTWKNKLDLKEFERSGVNEYQWCSRRNLQVKRVREVAKLAEELESRLERFNIIKPRRRPEFKGDSRDPIEQLILKMVICGAFYPNYAIKEESDEREAVKYMSNHDPLRTVVTKGLPMNEGILYQKQIKDYFSACWNDPAPRISTEESRAFIEFCWKPGTSQNERRVHPGVYIAIKTRQIGLKCQLDQLDRDETKKRLYEVQKMTAATPGGLRTNRLQAEAPGSTDNYLSIDLQTSTIYITVTEVVECGHFWAKIMEPTSDELEMNIMGHLNTGGRLQPISHRLTPGTLVAAPYVDQGQEQFYRARVETVNTEKVPASGGVSRSLITVEVFYIDFGNRDTVNIDRLCELPGVVQSLPHLAREFFLKGVRPSSVTCSNGVWNRHASRLFQTRTLNKTLLAQVYSVVDGAFRVELVERLPGGAELSFNNELVRLNLGEPAEEPYLSQQNHEWLEARKEQGMLTLSMPSDSRRQVTLSASASGDDARTRRKARKLVLTGPNNPLEMAFSSMTFAGRQRVVRIDPDSVNSVAIDDNPENKFTRLMVAHTFSLNPAGNSMIARDTTIMPQIPGLPALATLLWTPYVEYRADPKCERYIGALCGLGFDEMGCSILPDHDIELVFETTYDSQDIELMNAVRTAVNVSVGSNDSMAVWSVDRMMEIQRSAREKLLDLLKKQREPVEQNCFRRMYEWNQISPDDICYHGIAELEEEPSTLLKLHNAISLEEPSPSPDAMRRTQDMLWHLEELHRKVDSRERTPVTCELCMVPCPTSQFLAIHMATDSHQRKVEGLRTKYTTPKR